MRNHGIRAGPGKNLGSRAHVAPRVTNPRKGGRTTRNAGDPLGHHDARASRNRRDDGSGHFGPEALHTRSCSGREDRLGVSSRERSGGDARFRDARRRVHAARRRRRLPLAPRLTARRTSGRETGREARSADSPAAERRVRNALSGRASSSGEGVGCPTRYPAGAACPVTGRRRAGDPDPREDGCGAAATPSPEVRRPAPPPGTESGARHSGPRSTAQRRIRRLLAFGERSRAAVRYLSHIALPNARIGRPPTKAKAAKWTSSPSSRTGRRSLGGGDRASDRLVRASPTSRTASAR